MADPTIPGLLFRARTLGPLPGVGEVVIDVEVRLQSADSIPILWSHTPTRAMVSCSSHIPQDDTENDLPQDKDRRIRIKVSWRAGPSKFGGI